MANDNLSDFPIYGQTADRTHIMEVLRVFTQIQGGSKKSLRSSLQLTYSEMDFFSYSYSIPKNTKLKFNTLRFFSDNGKKC